MNPNNTAQPNNGLMVTAAGAVVLQGTTVFVAQIYMSGIRLLIAARL